MTEHSESESEPVESATEALDETETAGGRVLPFPTHRIDPVAPAEPESPPLRDVIGEVLRDERLRQERTLADVADDAAVSLPYLSEVERGRKEVSSDLLDAIVRSLGIDLADVLERAADRLRIDHLRIDCVSGPGARSTRSDWRGPQAQLLAA